MNIVLDPVQIRVIGALIEKSLATPDIYPLTLAGLTAACNQKSNRDPVMKLSETEVQSILDALIQRHLVRERNPAGSRVSKFSHRLDDSLGLTFGFDARQLGVLCVLLLRGPQTPGELRTRTNRLCDFDNVSQIEEALLALATAERGPYTVELPRQPGQRECRHAHLFGGEVDLAVSATAALAEAPGIAPPPEAASLIARIGDLEERVELLELELAELRELRAEPIGAVFDETSGEGA